MLLEDSELRNFKETKFLQETWFIRIYNSRKRNQVSHEKKTKFLQETWFLYLEK
jgi:hypothetical protein